MGIHFPRMKCNALAASRRLGKKTTINGKGTVEGFEEFRQAGHQAIDAIADFFDSARARAVTPNVDREFMRELYANTISDQGTGIVAAVEEFTGRVFDQSLCMSNPLYLGLVNSSPFPIGVIGDMITSSLDNNAGAFHQGPTIAATEREVIRALCEQLQYEGSGLMLPGGSYVNFHALQLARDTHFPEWQQQGPTAQTRQPRVYVSAASHFSNNRGLLALGLGARSIVSVPVVGRGEMDMSELEMLIRCDLDHGHQPFAIVTTLGTTGTGAIDDIESAARIALEFDLWLHIDACYGGAVGLLPDWKATFEQVKHADSLAVDLHKWFYMPLTAGVVLTRNESATKRSFEIGASYIPDQGHVEAYRRGLPTSRRGSSLGVWLALRAHGWDTIRDSVKRDIELTRVLESKLDDVGFRVLPGGQLSIACARWEPKAIESESLDDLQIRLADEVRKTGKAWFATTQHEGNAWLRFNMVNLHTRESDLDELMRHLQAACERILKD